jgi:hypothetical protein
MMLVNWRSDERRQSFDDVIDLSTVCYARRTRRYRHASGLRQRISYRALTIFSEALRAPVPDVN